MVAEDEVLQCLHMSLQIADHEEEQFELVDTWFCSSEDLLYSHVSDILDECDVAEDTQHLYKHWAVRSQHWVEDSHQSDVAHCTHHRLLGSFESVGEDRSFESEAETDEEVETADEGHSRVVEYVSKDEDHSEDRSPGVSIPVVEFAIELRSENEGVGRVVDEEREQQNQVEYKRKGWKGQHHWVRRVL